MSPALLWSQVENTPAPPAPAVSGPAMNGPENSSEQMVTPPPVSGQTFPIATTSEERSNYLRGGLAFTSAYTDNAVGSVAGHPVSDVSYSVAPFISLDETTPRLHIVSTYAPGFTFYQRESGLNEQDQNASINLQYRLSPHVTLSGRDGFQKSSNVFNQPDLAASGAVSGSTQEANFSVIAPIADRLSNSGNVGIAAQFAANQMVGASGTFTNLHYPDQAEVPGLFDSSTQAGSVFYALRASKMHYLGVTYQYQRLLSYPTAGQNETQTQAVLFFYTLYASSRLSFSAFGGPQYANVGPQFLETGSTPLPGSRSWNPAAGGSLSWQARRSSFAMSYLHAISGGGGLIGAVKMDSANASFRQQLSNTLSASVAGGYAQNDILGAANLLGENGHTVSGTAAVQQQFHQHVNLQLGYTRLHQDYSAVAVLAATPNTNREFVSISYQFARPLGR
ncbi:MAG TPA: hypothetical protein VJX47_10960 [Candidatus Sulfotelmatobacter sp.]|nr:hypothetical protein [Candidatus Sulfotelmatobacter sp.]